MNNQGSVALATGLSIGTLLGVLVSGLPPWVFLSIVGAASLIALWRLNQLPPTHQSSHQRKTSSAAMHGNVGWRCISQGVKLDLTTQQETTPPVELEEPSRSTPYTKD